MSCIKLLLRRLFQSSIQVTLYAPLGVSLPASCLSWTVNGTCGLGRWNWPWLLENQAIQSGHCLCTLYNPEWYLFEQRNTSTVFHPNVWLIGNPILDSEYDNPWKRYLIPYTSQITRPCFHYLFWNGDEWLGIEHHVQKQMIVITSGKIILFRQHHIVKILKIKRTLLENA